MKTMMLNAVVVMAAVGLMASCSSLDDSTSTGLKLIPKDRAMASMGGGSGFYPHPASVSLLAASAQMPKDRHGMPTYSDAGQRKRYVRTTSYSHMENEVGAPGRMNASGTVLKYGAVRSAGADWSRYPVGTTFKIKGLPHTYVVDDYGSSLVGTNTIDIYHPTLSSMKAWATRPVEISVIRWGSMERTVNLLKGRTKYRHCARMYYAARQQLTRPGYASTSKRRNPSL